MKKPSINAIYPTDKCPTFYLCNDGMYSDKNGRNACNRHGGLYKGGTTAPMPEKLKWNAKQWRDREPLPSFADGSDWKLKKKEIESNEFFKIQDFTNTKTGEKLKLVTLLKRVDSTVFDILRKNAKKTAGYWSGFAKGFLFSNIFDAENFINMPFGELGEEEVKQPTRAQKATKKAKSPAIKKVGKISFKMPEGAELKENLEMGKNALDVIKDAGYKYGAQYYKNPSFLYPILVYLKYNADKTPDKYARGRGDFYKLDYDGIKVIAPIWFKEMYPDAKNVRISRPEYSRLVLSATFPAAYKEKQKEIEDNAHGLLWQFNYDDSDSMTDYFHSRFYLRENITFEDAELSKKNKNAPKYFWAESKKGGWFLSDFYFGSSNKNKISHAKRIELKKKKTENLQDVFDRAKAKYSTYGINFDGAELAGVYSGYGIYKKSLLNGDITEEEARRFYDDSISGVENKVTEFVLYNSDFVGYSVLAFLTYKALSKWTKK